METERKRRFIINAIYYAFLAVLVFVGIKYFLPLLTPFVIAFVIAYLLRWPTKWVVRKWNLPYKPVALAFVLLFYCTVGILVALLVLRAVAGVQDLITMIPGAYTTHVVPALSSIFIRFENFVYRLDSNLFAMIAGFDDEFMSWLGSMISGLSGKAVSWASSLAASIPGLFIQIVLMIISTFFIAADFRTLRAFCLRQMNEKAVMMFHQVKDYLVGTLFVVIWSYVVIATLTFVELSIGLSIIGIPSPVLIAFLIAIFDILPVLGTGGIMVPWSVICLLQGNVKLGLSLLILYVAITVIRNVVEPKIVGAKLGLHPVVTLASMFAGVQLLGVVGLFGFPIGLSLLCYLNNNGTIHVFKKEE